MGGALALWLALRPAPRGEAPDAPAVPTGAAVPAPEGAAPPQPPTEPTEPSRAPVQNPFTREVRDFFDSAEQLSTDEREGRAEALRGRIEEEERRGTLVPQEALVLRLALLRVTLDDPAVLDHESRKLVESYQAAEAARPPVPPDPRFEAYREREAEIVREVMALDEIPGDLTRSEYLRRRLRELRSEVYSGASPTREPD